MEALGAKPFLKWAGGKRQLLPVLRRFYPASFNNYWEPFLGSGAAFFDLWTSGRLAGHGASLLDSNADLIACYRTVRDEPDAVISALERLASEHEERGISHYYDVRDRQFNPLRKALARAPIDGIPLADAPFESDYTPELAAMLIYLNRTGFNGLFRLNASGAFNVPAGRYRHPRICDSDNLQRAADALKQPSVSLDCLSFDYVAKKAEPGDFLYFDPPYAPVSRTAQFTSYTAGGFGEGGHRHLQQMVVELAQRGCQVLVSNSTAPAISRLYEQNVAARKAGLRCYRVPARRAINSNGSRRGAVAEFLITNINPADV